MGNMLDCLKPKDYGQQTNESFVQSQELQKTTPTEDSMMDTITHSDKIQENYTFLNPPIGRGSRGEVRKAINKKSGMVRAVKIISKTTASALEQQNLLQQIEILRMLDHPNILKILEFYEDNKFFYIVTELCTGGELLDRIQGEGQFSEKKAAQVMKQVLSAICYCHRNKIIHRDLKPENLLYESDKRGANLKITDFGTNRSIGEDPHLKHKSGTPYYVAPEVLKKKYNEKCDIWSCGVILYILLCGYPPFSGTSDKQVLEHVSKGKYDFAGEEWAVIGDDAKNLIRKMIEIDPAKRYSAEQCLADPWIQKHKEKQMISVEVMQMVIKNMKSFRSQQKLQQAAFMYMINYLTTKEEKNELLKTFQQLDVNGDGILTKDELLYAYKNILGPHKAEEEVNKIMEEVDKNGSGSIDYTEFVAASINRDQVLSRQRLEMAFKTFDKDGSGCLTKDELRNFFGGGKIPEDVWNAMIGEVDKNGDGEISLQEFKEMMLRMGN